MRIPTIRYNKPLVDRDERDRIAAKFVIDGKKMWGHPANTRGWQVRAAKHLGRTTQTISNWANGHTPIPVEVLELVAQALSRETTTTVLTSK